MKKLIAVLLIVLLVPVVCIGEDELVQTFDNLTYEQLLYVNQIIQPILFKKGALVNGVKIPAGVYTVGEDIPAGTYRIEYNPLTELDFCSFLATNEAEFFGFSTILGYGSTSEIGKLELTDGTRLELSGGEVLFYTYTGLFN